MRLLSAAVYLTALWTSHALLTSHYISTCQSSFLAALTGHGSTYCTLLQKGLRAIELAPLLLATAAHDRLIDRRGAARPFLEDG